MAFGAFLIMFTGFPHIWSIYQPYVMEETGWSTAVVSICFYLPTLFFVFGNMIGGRIYDRQSPRTALLLGGSIFTTGVVLSGILMGTHPMIIYLTLGVMQGIGQGMVYAVILATAQRWFQDRTGFATGVVITANGLCGFVMSPISKQLLESGGSRLALITTGILIGIASVLALYFVKQPEKFQNHAENDELYGDARQYTPQEMLRTRKFYYLAATMLFGLMPYYLLSPISQTLQIERGISEGIAVASVMAGSVINAGIRLVLPSLADRVGRIICIQSVLCTAMVSMCLLLTGIGNLTTAAVVLAYGCFGGIMGSFPSLTSSVFGLKHAGENYGIVMSGIVIVTALSPMISQTIEKVGIPVYGNFVIGLLCAFFAWICIGKLKSDVR